MSHKTPNQTPVPLIRGNDPHYNRLTEDEQFAEDLFVAQWTAHLEGRPGPLDVARQEQRFKDILKTALIIGIVVVTGAALIAGLTQ